jgi:hypothetical protein
MIKNVLMLSAIMMAVVGFGTCPDLRADVSQDFILSVGNGSIAATGSGPYGTITITGVGSGPTFTSWKVAASSSTGYVYGDHNIVDLNVASGAGNVTNLQVTAFAPSTNSGSFSIDTTGGDNVDGFGTFSLRISDGNGFSAPYTSFTLTFNTANAVTLSNLLGANGQGARVAAHIAPASNTACTGYAGDAGTSTDTTVDSNCTPTPEPNSLVLLFASGLFGLLVLVGRRVIV